MFYIISQFKSVKDFDWRRLGKVTRAKDQSTCNCCYAFTVIATIESAVAIRDNIYIDLNSEETPIDLSEQQIVDCSDRGNYQNNGCNYGYIDDSYQYAIDNGIVSEKVYPYINNVEKLEEFQFSINNY